MGQKQLGLVSWAVGVAVSVCAGAESSAAKHSWQKLSSVASGEETEVADADKALGERMQEEATQELID